MQVILFETVQNLGRVGDKVRVKPGYARNFLIPQGKAQLATPAAAAAVEERRAELEQQEAAQRDEAQTKADSISGRSFSIARKAGEEGKLFGSVAAQDVADALTEAGVQASRHEVMLPEGPIRQTGEYEITLRLHYDVETSITVNVVAE